MNRDARTRGGRGEARGPDAVGGPRRRRVNTEAPRRFTTPRYLGRCLTYGRDFLARRPFSHRRPRNDDTRDVRPTERRRKLQTRLRTRDENLAFRESCFRTDIFYIRRHLLLLFIIIFIFFLLFIISFFYEIQLLRNYILFQHPRHFSEPFLPSFK